MNYIDSTFYHVFDYGKKKFCLRSPDNKVCLLDPTSDLSGVFSDWKIGLPEEWKTNKYIPTHTFVKPRPTGFTQLYIISSGYCNLKCKYCSQRISDIGNMSEETMINSIQSFIDKSDNAQGIVFYGGEPLVNWKVDKIGILYALEKKPDIEITIFTNATLITPEIANFIRDHNVGIIVSIDGPEKYHNSARLMNDESGSFKKTIEGINNLKRVGCKYGFSCVIGPHNYENIEEVTEFLCFLDPVNIGMNILHGVARSNMEFNSKKGAEATIKSAKIAAKYGIEIEQFARRLRGFVNETTRYGDCPACGKRLVITPDGTIGPCEGAFPFLTDWFSNSMDDVVTIADKLSIWPISLESCEACYVKGLCGGGCALDAFLVSNDFRSLDERACELSKAVMDFVLEELSKYLSENNKTEIITIHDKLHVFSKYLSTSYRPLRTSSEFGEKNERR